MTSSRDSATRSNSTVGSAARRWFRFGLGFSSVIDPLASVLFDGYFHADTAIPDETAGAVEHRLTAHPELLPPAPGIDASQDEIEEGLSRGDERQQLRAPALIPSLARLTVAFSRQGADPDTQHLQHGTRDPGEVAELVL